MTPMNLTQIFLVSAILLDLILALPHAHLRPDTQGLVMMASGYSAMALVLVPLFLLFSEE
jgi:hypothetical protein